MVGRLRQMLATTGGLRVGTGVARHRWRPLVRLWLAVLAVIAVGGSVLEVLGPLAERSTAGQTPPQPQQAIEPNEAASQAAALLPSLLYPAKQAPVAVANPIQENADLAAIDLASRTILSRPLVVFHLPETESRPEAVQQVAAQAGLTPGQIATVAVADPPPRAIIRFYATADHPLARRLGRELTSFNYTWQIENRTARSPGPGQPLEVWLPKR